MTSGKACIKCWSEGKGVVKPVEFVAIAWLCAEHAAWAKRQGPDPSWLRRSWRWVRQQIRNLT